MRASAARNPTPGADASPKQLVVPLWQVGPLRSGADQKRVAVAVFGDVDELEVISRRLAFRPQALLRPAVERDAAGAARLGQGLGVHVAQHQHLERVGVLHDRGDQLGPSGVDLDAVGAELCFQGGDGQLPAVKHRGGERGVDSGLAEDGGEMLRGAGAATEPQGNVDAFANRGQLLDVVARPHAVRGHAVRDDLPGAALLRLVRPIERASARPPRVRFASGVLVHDVFAVLAPAVDADHNRLRSERSASSAISSGRSRAGELTETLSAPAWRTRDGVAHRADAAGDGERNVEEARGAFHPRDRHGRGPRRSP